VELCLFITARGPAPVPAVLDPLLAAVPGLARALVHRPASTHDPYLHDGEPPDLALQLYFTEITALEAACAGPLQALAPLLAGALVAQQAMLARSFRVPEPVPLDGEHCTYLVAYDGPAEDLSAWLGHYLAHHPPIMARFPGIRALEICTRLDAVNPLPFPHATCMQRNKVVFDSPAALTAALNSPVRHEMRADYAQLPPFTGAVTHFPMLTRGLTKARK
jgi:hypothetical protein